jgi:hypothetical protein
LANKIEQVEKKNENTNIQANVWRGDSFGAEQADSNTNSNFP